MYNEPAPQRYVIDGNIESGGYARVLITKTLPLYGTTYSTDLFKLVVTEARVVLSDGFYTEKLSLVSDSLIPDLPVFRSYVIKGTVGRVYTLTVTLGDSVYTAVDSIVKPVIPGGYEFRTVEGSDSLGYLYLHLSDPPEPGNCYVFWSRRIGLDEYFKPGGRVLNDFYFNGSDIEVEVKRVNFSFLEPETQYYQLGQSVIMKFASINYGYYDFISSARHESTGIANPIENHVQVPTNFSGDVLGAWGCYSVVIDTIQIKQP
jgi:hypothetical protein